MFKKIMLLPITGVAFIIGYALLFIFQLFQGGALGSSFLTALAGGVVFVSLWAFFVKVCTVLLSDQELASHFNLSGEKQEEYKLDTKDDLTMSELYSSEPEITSSYVPPPLTPVNYKSSEPDYDSVSDAKKDSSVPYMGPDGKFNLTVNDKTLRATPKDGAQAVRKTLSDDH